MKKLILACLVLALLVPSLQARPPKEKAGKVKDQLYTDKKYNFSFSIGKGWKYKVQFDKEKFRIVLTQSSYETPPQLHRQPGIYQGAENCSLCGYQQYKCDSIFRVARERYLFV